MESRAFQRLEGSFPLFIQEMRRSSSYASSVDNESE